MKRLWLAILFVLFAAPSYAAITFFGVASNPADNGSNSTQVTAVTPPASMVAGDLVYLFGFSSAGGLTFAISETGGQTWSDRGASSGGGSGMSSRLLTATFNGTWSANPSIDFAAAGTNTIVLIAFRPTSGAYTWALDVALAFDDESAATTFTKTAQTRTGASCLSVAAFGGDGGTASTWGTLTGTGWSKTSLSAQYRNTNGTDASGSFAYNIGTGTSNDVSQTQSQSVVGFSSMISFCEIAPQVNRNSMSMMGVGR